jgi:hypothetical protein
MLGPGRATNLKLQKYATALSNYRWKKLYRKMKYKVG